MEMLMKQEAAWNDGDIDGFMEAYWKSPDLTFSSGGNITRGWASTLSGYKQKYPTRDIMGRLTFSELNITETGKDAAFVLGRWRLERTKPISGVFSLVVRRMNGQWAIVHDHTSAGMTE